MTTNRKPNAQPPTNPTPQQIAAALRKTAAGVESGALVGLLSMILRDENGRAIGRVTLDAR